LYSPAPTRIGPGDSADEEPATERLAGKNARATGF